jgi:hypothetical protein
VSIIGDGVLELAEGVPNSEKNEGKTVRNCRKRAGSDGSMRAGYAPEVDRAIARSGDDLAVISRESNGEDILGVTDEATGGDLYSEKEGETRTEVST